jgi:hypothetical protein
LIEIEKELEIVAASGHPSRPYRQQGGVQSTSKAAIINANTF